MKKNSSVVFRLSFRYMILVASTIIVLSTFFMWFFKIANNLRQKKLISYCSQQVVESLEKDISPELMDIPYFVAIKIFNNDTQSEIYTNDPFIPLLEDTKNRVKKYYKKNFYADGDLNLLYSNNTFLLKEASITVQTSMDMDRDFSTGFLIKLLQLLLIVIVPVLVISFLISVIITKRTLKPVIEVTKAAKDMSSTNLETLLPVSNRNDEIDQLAQTFNLLFENLRKDFEQERNFTSNVSHELKTPVAGILGQANLLQRWGKEDPNQLNDSLNLIISEANSMNYIITNLLQISKLEKGREEIFNETLNIQTLFNRLKKEFSTINTDAEIVFEEKDVIIQTDIELLHQVLVALISNSIKFCGKDNIQNCQITLKANKEDDKTIIEVLDNGPGFDEEILPHVFERFYRGDKAHSRSVGGAGLGLSISESIIKTLGGTIQATNRTDSKGARIIISLV